MLKKYYEFVWLILFYDHINFFMCYVILRNMPISKKTCFYNNIGSMFIKNTIIPTNDIMNYKNCSNRKISNEMF